MLYPTEKNTIFATQKAETIANRLNTQHLKNAILYFYGRQRHHD